MQFLRGSIALLAISLLLLTSACATGPTAPPKFDADPVLLDGKDVFGHTVPAAEPVDLLSVSEEMEAYLRDVVRPLGLPYSRVERLMYILERDGFFVDHYDDSLTTTARETFENRKGNCLAYTNMFIALARASGLRAFYQIAFVDPVWDVENGYLVRQNHINVVLESVRPPGMRAGELTVDFNEARPRDGVRRRKVSDDYAKGLYHANLAVEFMYEDKLELAFAHLKRGIAVDPNNADVWNNLGTLYSVLDSYELAERAYNNGFALKPKSQAAIAGLAKTYRQLGNAQKAALFTELAYKRLAKNPYYYYASAETAFREEMFDTALSHVNRAIRLKKSDPKFYSLRAATASKLGDDELRQQSLSLYEKHSKPDRKLRRRAPSGAVNVHTPR